MYSKVNTVALRGLEGIPVVVETDVSNGLPDFAMVGFLSSEVREARERVRAAMRNSGFQLNARRITVNLSPADIRKEGTAYDLAIAVSLLIAYGFIMQAYVKQVAMLGELTLDGRLRPIRGVLPRVQRAYEEGIKTCFVPWENRKEASMVKGMRVIGVKDLAEAVHLLCFAEEQEPVVLDESNLCGKECADLPDFDQIHGQTMMKRAAEIAAAGMHNLLLMGAPGCGKSMVARRMPGILPELSWKEMVEVSRVYSVSGISGNVDGMTKIRPFRAPHHTISASALIGGGRDPHPGEISLANKGILFLDELPQFRKDALEGLRQPMEDGKVLISRVSYAVSFPSDTMIVGAMNPCMCGYYPDRSRCNCSEDEVRRYLQRISRPLLERFDVCVEAQRLSYEELTAPDTGDSSAVIRERVRQAHTIQKERFKDCGILFNGRMNTAQIKTYCVLESSARDCIRDIYQQKQMSARSFHRVLKVARTIADLDHSDMIHTPHLLEAVGYRTAESRFWG